MNRKLEHLTGLPFNIVTLGFYQCAVVGSHHYMTEKYSQCGFVIKSSYSRFKKDFEKVDWKIWREFPDSLFTNDCSSEFHASIVRINNVGYLLTSYGLIRANMLKKKKLEELNSRGANMLWNK
jgi:hypothetical protein